METQETKRICDNCALGTWDTKFANLDLYQKPTLLHCPHQKFAIIRGTNACEFFTHRNEK